MEQYIMPLSANRKLKAANSLGQTAYIYGATGYGKTAFIQKYMEKRRPAYLNCGNRRWDESDVPPQGTFAPSRIERLLQEMVVVGAFSSAQLEEAHMVPPDMRKSSIAEIA